MALLAVLQLIRDSFLMAVRETLGDRYTAHIEEIYQKTIDFILNTLVTGFGPHGSGAASSPAGRQADQAAVKAGANGHGTDHHASPPAGRQADQAAVKAGANGHGTDHHASCPSPGQRAQGAAVPGLLTNGYGVGPAASKNPSSSCEE